MYRGGAQEISVKGGVRHIEYWGGVQEISVEGGVRHTVYRGRGGGVRRYLYKVGSGTQCTGEVFRRYLYKVGSGTHCTRGGVQEISV